MNTLEGISTLFIICISAIAICDIALKHLGKFFGKHKKKSLPAATSVLSQFSERQLTNELLKRRVNRGDK